METEDVFESFVKNYGEDFPLKLFFTRDFKDIVCEGGHRVTNLDVNRWCSIVTKGARKSLNWREFREEAYNFFLPVWTGECKHYESSPPHLKLSSSALKLLRAIYIYPVAKQMRACKLSFNSHTALVCDDNDTRKALDNLLSSESLYEETHEAVDWVSEVNDEGDIVEKFHSLPEWECVKHKYFVYATHRNQPDESLTKHYTTYGTYVHILQEKQHTKCRGRKVVKVKMKDVEQVRGYLPYRGYLLPEFPAPFDYSGINNPDDAIRHPLTMGEVKEFAGEGVGEDYLRERGWMEFGGKWCSPYCYQLAPF